MGYGSKIRCVLFRIRKPTICKQSSASSTHASYFPASHLYGALPRFFRTKIVYKFVVSCLSVDAHSFIAFQFHLKYSILMHILKIQLFSCFENVGGFGG